MNTKTNNSIDFFDIILLSLALLFTFFVFRAKVYNLVSKETAGHNIMNLTFAISFTLFILQFKALRKPIVYRCWAVISLILLSMYFWLYNDTNLNHLDKSGNTFNYAHGLASPFCMLVLYQICRQLSLQFYKVELGIASKVTTKILQEDRKSTWLDIICTIGFIAIPMLTFLN